MGYLCELFHFNPVSYIYEMAKVSRQTINAIELGKYNLPTILALKIARVFETTVVEIYK